MAEALDFGSDMPLTQSPAVGALGLSALDRPEVIRPAQTGSFTETAAPEVDRSADLAKRPDANYFQPASSDYVQRVMKLEGSGKDPRSSAVGGFIDQTWLSLMHQNFPQSRQIPDQTVLMMRSDPQLRAEAVKLYARDNAAYLERRGIQADDTTLRMAHWFGPAGAAKVLSADKNTPMTDLFPPSVIAANPILAGKTAGQVTDYVHQEMTGTTLRQQWLGKLSPDVRALVEGMQERGAQDHEQNARLIQQYEQLASAAPAGSKERSDAIADMRRVSHTMMQQWQDMVKHPPVEKPIDAFANFGSFASIIGLLGGLLSRHHMTAALTASGKAMEAINTNNHEKFLQEYKAWDQQTTLGLKMIDLQNQEIRSLLDDQKIAEDEKRSRLSTLFQEYGMQHQDQSLRASEDLRMVEMVNANERAALGAKNQQEIIRRQVFENQKASLKTQHPDWTDEQVELEAARNSGFVPKESARESKAENYQIVDAAGKQVWSGAAEKKGNKLYEVGTGKEIQVPDGGAARKTGTKAQGEQFSDADVEYWANVLRNGGHLPPGLARTASGSDFVQKLMKRLPELGSKDPGDFIANVATVKADDRSLSNMTKMADAATSFERTASLNFDLALKLSKDAIPTDLGPYVNRWIMDGEKMLGDTNVPPYVTAMLTGANEYAKIMSGSTGAQGSTVDSRREAAELFSPYLSKGQIDRVVAVAKADMNNRKQSLYGQIDDIKARLRAAGSKEGTATQGQAPTAGAASMPVPPAFKDDPDGTGYRKDGKTWVKRGNQLIESPGAEVTPR